MPHIVIKCIAGPSREQLQQAAEEISAVVVNTLGKQMKHTSVSVEEYSFAEWEGVYNRDIKGKDNLLIKPGYTNPVTFD